MVKIILIGAGLVTSWVACSSSDDSGAAATPCAAVCAKQAEPMCANGLPSSTCVPACQRDADRAATEHPECKAQWDKYQSCRSTTSWVCDDMFGLPILQGC